MTTLRRKLRLLVALLVGCCLPVVAADRQLQIVPVKPAPAGEKRLALIIGNSAYKASPLRNPVNDARAIGTALSETGFKVTVVEDATQTAMRRAIRAFGDELAANGGVGVFYFAGHGMQVKGRNFLIPVNADIEREDEVEDGAVDANFVLSKMDSAKNALNIVILDACRNNPFARSFRSAAQGLAQMDAPSGTLVAFATAPGSVAADGDGANGLYTKHLLANIAKPGLPIEQLFKEVRIGVTQETGDRQVPWESSSLKGNFFFVPGEATLSAEEQRRQIDKTVAERVAAERAEVQRQMQKVIAEMLAKQKADLEEELKRRGNAAAAATPAPAPDRRQMELAFWESIKASSNPKDFQAYLDQYPEGTFVVLARNRIAPQAIAAAPAPVAAALSPVAQAPAKPVEQPKPAPAPVQAAVAPVAAISKPIEPPKPAPAQATITPPARPAEPSRQDEPVQLGGPTGAIQVASIAPTTSLVGMGIDNPRYPKIGDSWLYAARLSTGQQVHGTVEVTAVSEDGILDISSSSGSRAYSEAPHLEFNRALLNFSPYLLSFGAKPGQRWRGLNAKNAQFCLQPGNNCSFDAEVAGTEKVTTPAGTFDAVKVVVDMNVNFATTRVWRQYIFWYAEAAKRLVKTTVKTREGIWRGPDYDVELVSYKLN